MTPKNHKRPYRRPRYSKDERVGSFIVIEVVGRGEYSCGAKGVEKFWMYAVRCTRCGTVQQLPQPRLRSHEKDFKRVCRACREGRTKESIDIGFINWPVPPSVLNAQN